MKKIRIMTAVAAALLMIAAAVFADQIYSRVIVTNGATTGASRWTNGVAYSSIELARIWTVASTAASNDLTVVRITADGLYTQAVGTVSVLSSAGNTATFTGKYLKYGDKLATSSSIATGSTIMVEYLISKP